MEADTLQPGYQSGSEGIATGAKSDPASLVDPAISVHDASNELDVIFGRNDGPAEGQALAGSEPKSQQPIAGCSGLQVDTEHLAPSFGVLDLDNTPDPALHVLRQVTVKTDEPHIAAVGHMPVGAEQPEDVGAFHRPLTEDGSEGLGLQPEPAFRGAHDAPSVRDVPTRSINAGAANGTGMLYASASIGAENARRTGWHVCSECTATKGELGLEPTLALYVEHMVEIFREVRRVLRKDGTLWMEIGDTWSASGAVGTQTGKQASNRGTLDKVDRRSGTKGFAPKNLLGVPWRIAFALQGDGWILRSDIVWSRPNPMPEAVKDRPSKSHSYVFLFAKSPKYYYDAAAIAEPSSGTAHARGDGINPKARTPKVANWVEGDDVSRDSISLSTYRQPNAPDKIKSPHGQGFTRRAKALQAEAAETPSSYKGSVPGRKDGPGQDRRSTKAREAKLGPKGESADPDEVRGAHGAAFGRGAGWRVKQNESFSGAINGLVETRNSRSVWTIPTQPRSEDHYAAFPDELARRCIMAGCPEGGTVLDIFGGRGTVGVVAKRYNRSSKLIELLPKYQDLIDYNVAAEPDQLPFGDPQ